MKLFLQKFDQNWIFFKIQFYSLNAQIGSLNSFRSISGSMFFDPCIVKLKTVQNLSTYTPVYTVVPLTHTYKVIFKNYFSLFMCSFKRLSLVEQKRGKIRNPFHKLTFSLLRPFRWIHILTNVLHQREWIICFSLVWELHFPLWTNWW